MSKKIFKFFIAVFILIILMIFGVYSLSQKVQFESSKVSVVATFYPFYEFAKTIGGDKVDVINITPAGAEPHDYEPSAQDLAKAYQSDIFIYNGVKMEPWVDNFLKDYKNTIVKSSNGVELISSDGIFDPHFWLDPVAAKIIVRNIADGLIGVDAKDSQYFNERANSLISELEKLDQDFSSGLSTCQKRTAITSHEAFSYIAKRYSIELISIEGIDPSVEPDAATLARISDLVKQKNIGYIFFESLVSPKLADTIASETGAKSLVLDPIEGLTDEDQQKGKNYVKTQQQNLENLRTSLECR